MAKVGAHRFLALIDGCGYSLHEYPHVTVNLTEAENGLRMMVVAGLVGYNYFVSKFGQAMAGQQEDNLGLSLGGLYEGNSGGAHMARAVSVENGPAKTVVARRPRAVSLPTIRELDVMRLMEVAVLTKCLEASKNLVDQKEPTGRNGAPAAAVSFRRLPRYATYATGSGRLAASSSTVSSELLSSEGGSKEPVVTTSMMANTKKVTAEEPQLDNPAKRARISNGIVAWRRADGMARMPFVKTIGADGKKVEGFLYKYLQGDVSIVCACHGSFLSPAEFVKHAGDNEVANPLRQITVSL